MKNLKFISLAALTILAIVAISFFRKGTSNINTSNIVNLPVLNNFEDTLLKTFRNGNVDGLASYFDTHINISINEEEIPYTVAQAKTVLSDFFKTYPVKTFTIQHKGENNKGNQRYWIGDYQSTVGKYRIYLLTEKELITSIEISKEEEG